MLLNTLNSTLALTDLTPLAKMMAKKKSHSFKVKSLNDQESKLLEEMRSDETFEVEKALAENNYGQELSGAITAKSVPSSRLQKTDQTQMKKRFPKN